MKDQRGRLPRRRPSVGDNERIKRYIAKYTINAARTFGIDAHHRLARAGQDRRHRAVAPGLLRHQAGARDQGRLHRLGRHGRQRRLADDLRAVAACARNGAPSAGAKQALSACFVNPLAIEARYRAAARPRQDAASGAAARASSTSSDMLHNDACPKITVNPQTFDVFVDGELATCEPAQRAAAGADATCCDDRGHAPNVPGAARVGIGGPVGSGKTALVERLIPVMQARNIEVARRRPTISSRRKTPSGSSARA